MSKEYIGTKQITAYREDKNGFSGYHVIYSQGTDDEYHSWSPVGVFEDAYQPLNAMSFGHALVQLEGGERVARSGWNGKDMFIFKVQGSTFVVNRPPLLGIYPEGTKINYHAHIDMRTADGQIVPWACTQTDMLTNDWVIVT